MTIRRRIPILALLGALTFAGSFHVAEGGPSWLGVRRASAQDEGVKADVCPNTHCYGISQCRYSLRYKCALNGQSCTLRIC